MADEIGRTLEALQTAVQMEIDGKEFYTKASLESGNELGRKLLQTLSAEEDLHRQRFEEIYRRIRDRKAWPDIEVPPDRSQMLKTLFAAESEKIGTGTTVQDTELDAVQTAMDMENRSLDFYKARETAATYPAEKAFFEAVAGEESVHHALLLDYYEYLKDPEQWFSRKEHPSLDGG